MSFAPDSRVAIRRHRFNGQIPKSGGIRVLVLVVVLLLGYIPAAGAHPSAAAQPLAGDTPLKLAVIPPFTGVDPLQAARETLAHRGGPTLPNGPLCSPTQAIATPCAAPDAPVPSLWEPIPSLPLIPPRALMAYDAADRVVLLIDQAYSDAVSGVEPNAAAFYTFNGTGWTQLPLENGPPYALGGAVAYDSTLNSVVYEVPVAIGNGSFATTTWTFQAGTWTRIGGSTVPPARSLPGLSNDPGDSGVVLFGGANATNGALLNDTWVFSGGAWAEAAAGGAAPDPRSAPALAWSASASSVVLLGGCDALHRDPCANDTWRFSHGAWVQQVIPGPPVGPGATGPHTYVELSLNSTGGLMAVPIPASNGSPAGGWYSYAGSSWKSLLAPGAPRSVNGTAVVEDSDLAKIVVFPGTPGRLASNSTTWIGAGSSWSNLTVNAPSAREGAAFAFDSADGYAVLFGGDPSGGPSLGPGTNDTWRYSAGTWSRILTNQSPPAFTSPGLVYDVRDGYVLLFGGISGPSAKYVNQTWEFTKGGWSRITPHNSPSGQALRDGSLVYDAADGYVLWVGGPAGTAYTWTYVAGNWTNATSSVRPTGPPANGLAYDFGDAYVLEQGTEIPGPFGATYTTQTWSFLNGAWTNHTVSIGPPPLTGGSLSYDPLIPGVVLFGGQVPGSSGVNSTWIYRGGNWTESAGPFDPPPLVGATSTFDTADQALVLFGGTDQIFGPASRSESCSPSACNATYTWSTATLAHPYVSGFVAGEPTLDLGHSTNLTTTVTGGTGWIRYAYQDLPTGCVSQNVSVLACSPTTTGSFQPSVTVLDSVGHSAGTTTMLSVTSPLVIAVFNASPSVVPLAQRTLLSVKVAGGSGTTSYAYLGLPPGCTTQSIPTLPCSPKGSGDFPIVVSVTDTGGGSAGTALDLKVLSTGPPGGPSIDGFALEPAALVLGNSTTIVVNASGGDPPLRYAYSGLPPGCASLNVSSLGCDPTTQGVYELTLTVQGANGSSASVMTNLTVYPAGGGGGLQITSFSGSPGVVPLGQSTVISVTATDGLGALSYQYSGLPPGCLGENTSSLNCTPSANGSFRLYVLVTDSAGHRSGAFSALSVTGAVAPTPSISLFSAAPRTFRLGNPTILFVSVDGGTAPLQYAYSNLPPGCASADAAELNCTPTAPGHYPVLITVSDARSRSANASLTLVVLPAEVPAGSSNPFAGLGLGQLDSLDGGLALIFVLGAALLFAATEITVRRTRERSEGQDLVRALVESDGGVDPPGRPDTRSLGAEP